MTIRDIIDKLLDLDIVVDIADLEALLCDLKVDDTIISVQEETVDKWIRENI